MHPLVALPAAAAGVVLLGFTDRRWWLLFPAALLVAYLTFVSGYLAICDPDAVVVPICRAPQR